jgi:biopolymer transport protein ExbD
MKIGRRRYGMIVLDMTPMIDVVFLLLIFFLVTAQMSEMASTPVTLPEQQGIAEESEGAIGLVVNIDGAGGVQVGSDAFEPTALIDLAKDALARDARVVPVVRADRRAPAARLNEVIEGLRSGGCRSVRVATTRPKEAP